MKEYDYIYRVEQYVSANDSINEIQDAGVATSEEHPNKGTVARSNKKEGVFPEPTCDTDAWGIKQEGKPKEG